MPEHTPAPTPARSLYGFFMFLFSKTMLAIFYIWAFTPYSYLHYFNVYYYPQKYWSTAIPIQCLVALTVFAFFIYPSSNFILTANINNINTLCDPQSLYTDERIENNNIVENCICKDTTKCAKYTHTAHDMLEDNIVPQLHDLDIRYVCKKLYYTECDK